MDPFEEEREARFVRPLEVLLTFLNQAQTEVIAAKKAKSPQESSDLFDGAMNLLFHAMNLCQPVAHIRHQKGRRAFMWIECEQTKPPAYHWLLCSPDMCWRHGQEISQEICEAVVNRFLDEQDKP